MITLFIDTSTDTLTVALLSNDKVIDKNTISSQEHSRYAMIEIEKLFNKNNINPRSVESIMVTVGPGSFTGIRIGVTIAKTYAWACNINVIPISTLKAYALSNAGHKYYIPFIDARRGYVYGSVYDNEYNPIVEDSYILFDELIDKVKDLDDIVFIGNSESAIKPILDVERIYNYYKDEKGVNPHALFPNYLKKTEAEERLDK